MKISTSLMNILERSLSGIAPNREECIQLLSLQESSYEAARLRGVADKITRQRFGNEAMLLGQIGIETFPCPANCKFCVFGEKHTHFPETKMTLDEIIEHAKAFTQDGNLHSLFLMLMHEFNFEEFLKTIKKIRQQIPAPAQIVVNMGDFDSVQAREMKDAGVSGAYHVRRLREGVDTGLDPQKRLETIGAIKEAGLDWYYCCEPIGPEHSPEELADQILLGLEYECFQHAAMRRVWLPDSPLGDRGQITELRLAQVVAVVTLAMLENPAMRTIAVHEPNLIGLTSGANTVYAERGINPRDTKKDTANSRGLDHSACLKMLWEAGFTALRREPNETTPLTFDLIK